MNISQNLYEVSAEMLLVYLYPELEQEWVVHNKGTFYRNYNPDILDIDAETRTVSLTRDGYLRHLPQALISKEDELKGGNIKEKYEEIQKRIRLLEEAFVPFDTFFFRARLKAERKVSELLNERLEYILQRYFGISLAKEANPYIREVAVLLPYVVHLKGNLDFVRRLLVCLFQCEVQMQKGRYYMDDRISHWLPSVTYTLFIPGLTSETYREKNSLLVPLMEFIGEWFIPYEIHCKALIRDTKQHSKVKENLILNYNSTI